MNKDCVFEAHVFFNVYLSSKRFVSINVLEIETKELSPLQSSKASSSIAQKRKQRRSMCADDGMSPLTFTRNVNNLHFHQNIGSKPESLT